MAKKNKALEALFLEIAQKHIGADVETLEARDSDSLDFVETSVWGIRAALEAAYKAGQAAAPKGAPAPKGIRIRTQDDIGNVAYVVRGDSGWRCVLANGTPAALSYAGVTSSRETECRLALEDTTTAEQALAVLRRFSRRMMSVV